MAKNDDQGQTGDAGVAEVEKKVAESDDRGYLGEVADPTPNENYTFSGRAAGAPVPETDPELAEQARKAGQQK